MTTIALKDGVIACDSRATRNDMIVSESFQKIYLHDNTYFGFAGDTHHIKVVMDTISKQTLPKKQSELSNFYDTLFANLSESIALIFLCLPKTGKPYQVTFYDTHSSVFFIDKKGYAIGSGGEYATVAMGCGLNAIEAVNKAKEYDVYSGGATKSYSFK